jgi:predicted PurR-regulated permease PerM
MAEKSTPRTSSQVAVNEQRSQLISNAIVLACVAALLWGVLAVLRPFLSAIIWAAIIVVATWPIMLHVERLFGGHRGLAVAAMSSGLFVAVVGPVALLLGTLVARLPELRDLGERLFAVPWPAPPAWLERLPYGSQLSAQWQQAAAQSPDYWAGVVKPYLGNVAVWLSQHVGTIGSVTVDFLMTLILVVVFYLHGEALAKWTQRLAKRVGGARGVESAVLAGKAMRAIAAGVVVTALVEAVLSGFGLWVVGIPAAGVLTSIIFMLCVMQIGPMLVLIPGVLWLLFQQQVGWGIALGIWAVLVSIGEGIMRPWLIQRGAKLPFMLVLVGVIGGLLAFGVTGIFVGPMLLAVVQRLMERWMSDA